MKILVCITDFGTSQRNYLHQVLNEFDKMYLDFEFYRKYQFDIKVYTTEPLGEIKFDEIKVSESRRSAELKDALTWCHRQDMIDQQDNYDLFIYMENDILITKEHLDAFIKKNYKLPDQYIAGFMHYEVDEEGNKRLMALNHGFPSDIKVLEINGHKYASLTNQHQACYILTKKQLKRAIASGNYNTAPRIHNHLGQHYHFKETAASEPYTVCGLQKVIPLENIEDFLLHHLPNIYVKNQVSPLFNTPFYTLEDFMKKTLIVSQ